MRKTILAVLIISVVLLLCGASGCQKTSQTTSQTTATENGAAVSAGTGNASISSDVDSLSGELSGIDVNDSSAMTPVSQTDLSFD